MAFGVYSACYLEKCIQRFYFWFTRQFSKVKIYYLQQCKVKSFIRVIRWSYIYAQQNHPFGNKFFRKTAKPIKLNSPIFMHFSGTDLKVHLNLRVSPALWNCVSSVCLRRATNCYKKTVRTSCTVFLSFFFFFNLYETQTGKRNAKRKFNSNSYLKKKLFRKVIISAYFPIRHQRNLFPEINCKNKNESTILPLLLNADAVL